MQAFRSSRLRALRETLQNEGMRVFGMDDFVRCKACGYITTRKRLGTVCPACGVPAKMFEAYKHPLSAARRIPLDLHTHPVAVHFPQAFCLILFLLSLAVAMLPEHHFVRDLYSTQKVLALILPFFVLLSFATGLYDAKLRFRKWTTPFLQKKIFLGGLLFFISLALFGLAASEQSAHSAVIRILFTLLAAGASFCGGLLGWIGGRLLNAKFPG